jgi:hypothetical protein
MSNNTASSYLCYWVLPGGETAGEMHLLFKA